jgi:hypothetical protein
LSEDYVGKKWSAKMIFRACLRAHIKIIPFILPVLLMSIIANVFSFYPKRMEIIINGLVFLLFVGPIAGTLAAIIFLFVPNKWVLMNNLISTKGREFKKINCEKIITWSIEPIDELPGHHLLRIIYKKEREHESCIVLNETHPIENIKYWLTSHST